MYRFCFRYQIIPYVFIGQSAFRLPLLYLLFKIVCYKAHRILTLRQTFFKFFCRLGNAQLALFKYFLFLGVVQAGVVYNYHRDKENYNNGIQ